MIYRATGNIRAIQILLGHTEIENTVRYLSVDVEDALLLAERPETGRRAVDRRSSVDRFRALTYDVEKSGIGVGSEPRRPWPIHCFSINAIASVMALSISSNEFFCACNFTNCFPILAPASASSPHSSAGRTSNFANRCLSSSTA